MKPRVVGKFLTQYDNSPVPRRDIAVNVLTTEMGVPEDRAEAVFDMIMESAKAVGFVQKIKDKEYISLEGAGATEEEETYDPNEPIETLEETPAQENLNRTFVPPAPGPSAQSATETVLAAATKRVFITHGKNKTS